MFVEEYLRELRKARYTPAAAAAYVWKCVRRSVRAAAARPAGVRGVVLAGFVHFVVLFGVSVAISFAVDQATAVEFFVSTGIWLLCGLAWIAAHLGMFRADRELPASGLGLPNILTLGRLLCIPAFHVFITGGHQLLALVAFGLGGLTDVADGFAARKLGSTTHLGRVFDPIVDVLFNAGIAVSLTQVGYLPGWLLALILLRYGALMLGAAWIYVFRGPVAVRPTVLGKTTGVITTGLVFGLVVLRRFAPPDTADRVISLLYIAIGFVFVLSTIQVVLIGLYNIRHIRDREEPQGPMAVVLGTDDKERHA